MSVARNLFAASGLDLDKMMAAATVARFQAGAAATSRLSAHMTSKVRPFESNNVIAVLPGAGAALKNEGVMYTAHYDHLGIRPDMPGDNIYNGAMDNATGCGILLEIARAYAEAAQKPRALHLFRLGHGRGARLARLANTWASIRRFRRGKFRSISTTTT